ncbi:MAG: hypothetical protein QOD86_1226 [Miltoncostaeaceae bacterium]|jgi:hypothetical protein|nr:hypothetical protein [Miltoncostaeaceae bacterium]
MERRATGRGRRPGPRRPRHTIPRRRAAAAVALACLLAVAPAFAADPALDFGAAVPDTILDGTGHGTGFTRVIEDGGLEPDDLKLDTGRGVLLITGTAGDAGRSKADQDNALSVKVEAAGPYAVEATLDGPLELGVPGQSAGIYVGTGQDDYVKASVTFTESVEGEPGLFLALGSEGAALGRDWRRSAVGLSTATTVVLRLAVDPATGAVRASAKVGNGDAEPIDPTDAPIVLAGLEAPATAATAGIITTQGGSGTAFTVAYDRFALEAPPEARLSLGGTFRDGAPQVQVVATFTHPMDPDTVEKAFALLDPSGAPVPAAVTLSADGRTAVLDPQVALEPAATYTARLAATAADEAGRQLASAETLSLPPAVRAPASSPDPGMAPRGAADEPLCAAVPEPAPRHPAHRAVRLTAGQLLVNQRIAQAALRRAAAIEAWLDAGITADDLCGGGIGGDVLGAGIVTGGTPPGTAPAPARPRPLVLSPPLRRDPSPDLVVSARQLLTGQRIAQIALLRVRALERRLEAGLTGGDLRDGAVSQAKLAPGLGVLSARPAPEPPPPTGTAPIAPLRRGAGRVASTAAQLRVNQRIAQAAVRSANALTRRLQRGLTGGDFQAGSITAVDLAPGLRTS